MKNSLLALGHDELRVVALQSQSPAVCVWGRDARERR